MATDQSGFDSSKGLVDIDLPSNRSVFKILVDRVMRIQMVAHRFDKVLQPHHQRCKIIIVASKENFKETV